MEILTRADYRKSGTWANGCASQNNSGSHARYYTFSIGEKKKGVQTTITLEPSVDTRLYLLKGVSTTGDVVAQNDDSGVHYGQATLSWKDPGSTSISHEYRYFSGSLNSSPSAWTAIASPTTAGGRKSHVITKLAGNYGYPFQIRAKMTNSYSEPATALDLRFGTAEDDTLYPHHDSELFAGLAGIDTVSYEKSRGSVTVDISHPSRSYGGAWGDEFSSIEKYQGSRDGDYMTGSRRDREFVYLADHLSGGPGDDILMGRSGNDTLLGADGDDTLWGGDGSDTLVGGAGNDTLVGGGPSSDPGREAGPDTLTGGAGADKFYFTGNHEYVATITDYTLGSSKADSEAIVMCYGIGSASGSSTNETSGNDVVVRLTGASVARGTITLRGVANDANVANVNVLFRTIDHADCPRLPDLPEDTPDAWFANQTPFVSVRRLFMDVETNFNASGVCHFKLDTVTDTLNCPPGTLVSQTKVGTTNLADGQWLEVWVVTVNDGGPTTITVSSPRLEGHIGGPSNSKRPMVASTDNGKIGLAWSVDGLIAGYTLNGFQVRHRIKDANHRWTNSAVLGVSARTHTLTGLDPTKTYEVVVRPRNDGGEDFTELWGFGEHRFITPDAVGSTTPGAVAAPTVTAGSQQLKLNWLAAELDGGAAVHFYTVRHKVSTAADSAYVSKTVSAADPFELTLTGLTASTEYTVQIRANNVNGAGAWTTVKGTPTS